jgi:hypothetical protein
MLTILATWWRGLWRWGFRRRTDRTLERIAARHQRLEQELMTRVRPRPEKIPHGRPRGHGRRVHRPPIAEARAPPPAACCREYGIVTACDGVTDTVVCGVCRTRFQRSCPEGPILAPYGD